MPVCGRVKVGGRLLGPKTAWIMTNRTHFLVIPFFRTTEGDLVADEPIEVPDPARARCACDGWCGGVLADGRPGYWEVPRRCDPRLLW